MINPIFLLLIVAAFLFFVPSSMKRKKDAAGQPGAPVETPGIAAARSDVMIPALASVLAAVQNGIMFNAGVNGGGEYNAPVFFAADFAVEVLLIWVVYFFVRLFFPRTGRSILIPLMFAVLMIGQELMPQSQFWVDVRRDAQHHDLSQIQLAVTAYKPPSPEQANTSRFEFDYTLQFPHALHYEVNAMQLDPFDANLVAEPQADDSDYFAKDYKFVPGKPYGFRTVFHASAPGYDLSDKRLTLTVCEGEGYDSVCDEIPVDARKAIGAANAAIEAAKPHHRPQDIAALQARAEQGDSDAMYELGRYYYDADEIPQDPPKAIHWFRENVAAYQIFWNGDAAKIRATSFPQFGDKEVNAWANQSHEGHESAIFDFPRYKDDAEKGDAAAQVYLGRAYTIAAGTKQDFAEAYFWLSVAANNPNLYHAVAFSEKIAPDADAAGRHLSSDAIASVKARIAEWKPKPR